jgi:hypothetical protein
LDEKGFRKFCALLNLDEATIRACIEAVEESEALLKEKHGNRNLGNATLDDLEIVVSELMKSKKNTQENFLALLRYSRFVNNREVEIALMERLGGSEVMKKLSETLKQTVCESKYNEIFDGIELPPLGTHSRDKPKITKKLMERLEAKLGEKACREVLLSGPHARPRERYLPEREDFLASKSIDAFLEQRHKEYVKELEENMKNKTLNFTQEIDEEVLEYVRNTPTCQNGVREGNVIYITKIPYMAKKYLREKDEKKKRYYYCHCPWVREAIMSNVEISPNFCYCSAAYEKRPWDVIFDQTVKADVIQTVLNGDLICKFAIHIPKEFLGSEDATPKK